ncbi:SDR family NAD(P)-dependent oxidoreductase [Limnochorda pilosa]|uniref:Ketoreductase n=1 Tax=Limnochorda pilosa TaxID=1555112 RepID=A0A0K2SHX2_LIMPI|nr:ketoreductase [Limnochorda pilosa]
MQKTSRGLEGKVAVVTGGGSGIGRATALHFHSAGAKVLVAGRRADALAETVAGRPDMAWVTADVRREDDAATVIATALELWDRIDVLVNNAGVFSRGPLEEVTTGLVQKLFETNVLGPTLLAKAAVPHLKVTRGSIVNVSSTFGHKASPMIGHCAASKAALEHLTRCWALELAPHGVRVNAVAPGPTEPPALAASGLPPTVTDTIKNEEARKVPLGRRGEPDDVAAWIVALANPGSAWVTGQVLCVDGGLSVA